MWSVHLGTGGKYEPWLWKPPSIELQLRDRLQDHLYDIQKDHNTNVARHWNDIHHKDVSGLVIQAVEKIVSLVRGGDKFKILCNREVYWIFLTLGYRQVWISSRMSLIIMSEFLYRSTWVKSRVFMIIPIGCTTICFWDNEICHSPLWSKSIPVEVTMCTTTLVKD